VQSGKNSGGPENSGRYDKGRGTAQCAVERLRHEVMKIHPESAADCGLAIRPGIQRQPDARPEIFGRSIEPRSCNSWLGIGQRIPKVGDLSIDFRRNCRELVTESKIQSQIGASLVVILEIKSEQVLAPTANGIASWNVVI